MTEVESAATEGAAPSSRMARRPPRTARSEASISSFRSRRPPEHCGPHACAPARASPGADRPHARRYPAAATSALTSRTSDSRVPSARAPRAALLHSDTSRRPLRLTRWASARRDRLRPALEQGGPDLVHRPSLEAAAGEHRRRAATSPPRISDSPARVAAVPRRAPVVTIGLIHGDDVRPLEQAAFDAAARPRRPAA
jgi:hypothetical protein